MNVLCIYLFIYSIYFICLQFLFYTPFLFNKYYFIFIISYNYYSYLFFCFKLFSLCNFCLSLYFQLLLSKLKINNNIIFCLIDSFSFVSLLLRYKIFGTQKLAVKNLALQLEYNLILYLLYYFLKLILGSFSSNCYKLIYKNGQKKKVFN